MDQLNQFGGGWTERKIQVFIKYLRAYLEIMKDKSFELTYFDGFAGCGEIEPGTEFSSLIEGVAPKVVEIDSPTSFDILYLVEKDSEKAKRLKDLLYERFPHKKKKIFVVQSDCNEKLIALSRYLKQYTKKRRCLAFIDPFGMQVNWDSIASLKGLHIDIWLLVPSSAVNRMLKRNGEISPEWLEKLSRFLGISIEEIEDIFYLTNPTLFGGKSFTKQKEIFDKIVSTYIKKLKENWRFVSKAMPLKNSKGAPIFHFIFASQVEVARKIANDIISKEINS